MLSAVELHSGASSGFYPSFSRPPSDVQFTPPMSMSSDTEFARPKPKSIGALNGLSPIATSPTHKYSHHHEQNGPVNLAVNHHHQAQREKEHGSDKEIDVVGLGNSGASPSFSTAGSPRISSAYPANLGSNAYQALNYNFYGNRYG
jgi:hypothetical protein